jgi:hypothetical protein
MVVMADQGGPLVDQMVISLRVFHDDVFGPTGMQQRNLVIFERLANPNVAITDGTHLREVLGSEELVNSENSIRFDLIRKASPSVHIPNLPRQPPTTH